MIGKIINNIYGKYKNKFRRIENIPEFLPDGIVRYRVVFSGLVQGVGFRYETWLVAKKLGLTGFADNMPDGRVCVEVQGAKNKIQYLIHYMKSHDRICVENVEVSEMELKEENEFIAVY